MKMNKSQCDTSTLCMCEWEGSEGKIGLKIDWKEGKEWGKCRVQGSETCECGCCKKKKYVWVCGIEEGKLENKSKNNLRKRKYGSGKCEKCQGKLDSTNVSERWYE